MANLIRRNESNVPSVPSRLSEWDPFRIMDSLMRWDPFQGSSLFQESAQNVFMPRFDVKEAGDSYVFKADLPGVKPQDVDISVTGNRLTISGKRDVEERQEGENYYALERSHGTFSRSFTLPTGTDSENVKADLNNGVLTLTLPKKPEHQARKIQLNADTTQGGQGTQVQTKKASA
jgi:HSP20 family protein